MNELLQHARKVLDAQPFSKLLGTTLEHIDTQSATLGLPLREELKQQHGFAHGGILSYLADNALTFAGGMALGPAVLTSEFKINYVRPALGTSLAARASVIHAGRRQAVCRCDIFALDGDSEKLVATAQGTITKIESEKPA